jgi:hypothetical protein
MEKKIYASMFFDSLMIFIGLFWIHVRNLLLPSPVLCSPTFYLKKVINLFYVTSL